MSRPFLLVLALVSIVGLFASRAVAESGHSTPRAATARGGKEARRKAQRARPAVEVADMTMPAGPSFRSDTACVDPGAMPLVATPDPLAESRPKPAIVAPEPSAPGPTPTPRPPAPPLVASGPTFALGVRYRPSFLPSVLLRGGARIDESFLFHGAAFEGEWRWRRFTLTVGALYLDLSTPGFLVGSPGKGPASYVSFVRSDLRAVAPVVDLAWAVPLGAGVDLELGASLGAAFTFGSLVVNWVYEVENGGLPLSGRSYNACRTANDGPGCRPQDHATPTPVKVGGYLEPSWLEGGAAPVVVPWVVLPQVALRAELGADVAMKVSVGAGLTGLSVGLGVYWGLGERRAP